MNRSRAPHTVDSHVIKQWRETIRAAMDQDFAGNQTALARAMGISQSAISEILAGNRAPGSRFLVRFQTITGRRLAAAPDVPLASEHEAALAFCRGILPAEFLRAHSRDRGLPGMTRFDYLDELRVAYARWRLCHTETEKTD